MMRRLLFFILLACLFSEVSAQEPDSVKYTVLESYDFHLQYIITDPAILVDVRYPSDYRKSRIKDAINITTFKELDMLTDTLDKNVSIFIYCVEEDGAIGAAKLFFKRGFFNIFILQGGFEEWKKDGFPLDKKRRSVKKRNS